MNYRQACKTAERIRTIQGPDNTTLVDVVQDGAPSNYVVEFTYPDEGGLKERFGSYEEWAGTVEVEDGRYAGKSLLDLLPAGESSHG
jgi:hypothetical protein